MNESLGVGGGPTAITPDRTASAVHPAGDEVVGAPPRGLREHPYLNASAIGSTRLWRDRVENASPRDNGSLWIRASSLPSARWSSARASRRPRSGSVLPSLRLACRFGRSSSGWDGSCSTARGA